MFSWILNTFFSAVLFLLAKSSVAQTSSSSDALTQTQLNELTCVLFGGEFCNNHTITTRQVEYPTSYSPYQPTRNVGNSVRVEIYAEAQCGDSTRFMRRQLWPTFQKFANTGRLNLQIYMFGKASCQPEAGDYNCRCQHGQRECDLNQLMNCVQDYYNNDPVKYMPVFSCVQGKTDLDYAKDYCIANNPDLPLDNIMKCTTGRRGRMLMALAGQKTAQLQPPLTNVPLLLVDGEKSIDAFYEFEDTICSKMVPKPEECSKQ